MAKQTKKSKQILRIMEGLKCSAEEAKEIYEADMKIEHNEPVDFGFDKAKEKEITAFTNNAGKRQYNFSQRERKPNPTKGAIIAEIAELLKNSTKNAYDEITLVNKERQIDFLIDGVSFTLSLVQHRGNKKNA